MGGWTARDLPDLTGRRAVVTGANSGLGFHTALELSRAGASVVMAARDERRGAEALDRVRQQVPGSGAELASLDLADLASVRRFAAAYGTAPIDILVNNAGVMAIPRRETLDGFEMQFGTNHLGHFALTGLLLPALTKRPGSRVVTVSSFMHWLGTMNFDDLMGERRYQTWSVYEQSKLANLLFMRELDHRGSALGLVSVAAHPGYASTNLQAVGPQMVGSRVSGLIAGALTAVAGQSAANGALPQLYAAAAPDVVGGEYFGPRGPGQQRGRPTRVGMSKKARDDESARRLWEVSEELTGVRYLSGPGGSG
jgi:NAD(P)-dependent dehydrogenase (short-subunit alcohol dehydrogenase family)